MYNISLEYISQIYFKQTCTTFIYLQFYHSGVIFMGNILFGGKFHSCRRAGMCMSSLSSDNGKSIQFIKQALADGNKCVTLKLFQK